MDIASSYKTLWLYDANLGALGHQLNWEVHLRQGSNLALYEKTNQNTDVSTVERIKAALLLSTMVDSWYWFQFVNDRGAVVYQSANLRSSEVKSFQYLYVSRDFRRLKSVSLNLSKSKQGIRLVGRIRLPFNGTFASNGRYIMEFKMSDPTCAGKQISLFSRVSSALKAKSTTRRNRF